MSNTTCHVGMAQQAPLRPARHRKMLITETSSFSTHKVLVFHASVWTLFFELEQLKSIICSKVWSGASNQSEGMDLEVQSELLCSSKEGEKVTWGRWTGRSRDWDLWGCACHLYIFQMACTYLLARATCIAFASGIAVVLDPRQPFWGSISIFIRYLSFHDSKMSHQGGIQIWASFCVVMHCKGSVAYCCRCVNFGVS